MKNQPQRTETGATGQPVSNRLLIAARSFNSGLLAQNGCNPDGGFTATAPATPALVAVTCTPLPTAIPSATATATATSTPSPLPTATSTPTIPLIPSPTTRPTPAYDETVLDTLTRIAYIEAGAAPDVRPESDEQFAKAVQSIAWIARNWIEVGDPGEDEQGHKWVHREESYQDTYKHFDAYNSGKYQEITKDSPGYDLVYAEVKKVLSGQVSDWTGGALYNLNYDLYHAKYETNQHLSSSIIWQRSETGKWWAVYLFKTLPIRK